MPPPTGSTGCWRARSRDLSRSRLQALVRDGRVKVAGAVVRESVGQGAAGRRDRARNPGCGAGRAAGRADRARRRLRGRRDHRDRQAGRASSSIRPPAMTAAHWSTRSSPIAARASPASAASSGRGSCTASTRTRAGSSSSQRPTAPIAASRRSSPTMAAPARSSAPTSRSSGACPTRPAAPSTARSPAARQTARKWRSSPTIAAATPARIMPSRRCSAPPGARGELPALPAGDRPHAPDPGPYGEDRPPAARRRELRGRVQDEGGPAFARGARGASRPRPPGSARRRARVRAPGAAAKTCISRANRRPTCSV